MMTTEIVNEIAHLMRQREMSLKDPKEVKLQKHADVAKDEVTLSKAGEAFAHPVSSQSEFEKEQFMKVERLKTLVINGTYQMDKDMVDAIASKIAKMFM